MFSHLPAWLHLQLVQFFIFLFLVKGQAPVPCGHLVPVRVGLFDRYQLATFVMIVGAEDCYVWLITNGPQKLMILRVDLICETFSSHELMQAWDLLIARHACIICLRNFLERQDFRPLNYQVERTPLYVVFPPSIASSWAALARRLCVLKSMMVSPDSNHAW